MLLATPLRELDGQTTLWRYVSDVFYRVGNENDFRYFLPRILDISVYDPANANYPEVVLSKLTLANWRSWPADERQVIEQFMDAWFDLALERDLAEADDGWIGREAEGVLCGMARAGISLLPWLVRFHEPSAAPVLADLKARFPTELSAFWEEARTGYEELATILVQGRC